jgi:5-methylcytosine-specific restriction endonuclease McrA
MPRTRTIPCAGGCGALCWKSRTCRPPGEQMCRPCQLAQTAAKNAAPNATCAFCQQPFRSYRTSKHGGRFTETCGQVCAGKLGAIRRGQTSDGATARKKRKHSRRRRAIISIGSLTATRVKQLKAEAHHCPLCSVAMVDEPFRPASKELDHIVPLLADGGGGRHEEANVRVICRRCNLARQPKGAPSLRAPDSVIPKRPPRRVAQRKAMVVVTRDSLPPVRQADGQRAARLRSAGWAWRDIAREIGTSPANVGSMARRYGDPELVASWRRPVSCASCAAPLPKDAGLGRPRKYCADCRPRRRWPLSLAVPLHGQEVA